MDGQASAHVEITEEMVSAGEAVLEDRARYFEERALATMIYTAMEQARRQSAG